MIKTSEKGTRSLSLSSTKTKVVLKKSPRDVAGVETLKSTEKSLGRGLMKHRDIEARGGEVCADVNRGPSRISKKRTESRCTTRREGGGN